MVDKHYVQYLSMNGVSYKMQIKSNKTDYMMKNRITKFLNSISQSMTEPSTKRIAWIDMAKAIAILLMVIGHEASGSIYTWIFSFHMPLFFILSGYTARRVDTWYGLRKTISKLFKRIWILAALMIILLAIENYLFYPIQIVDVIKVTVKGIIWGSNGARPGLNNVGVIWFLFAYFWARIIFDMGRLIIKDDRYNGVMFAILAYAGYLISQKIWLPQALDIALVAAFFMWIGAILRSYHFFSNSKTEFLTILAALVFWLWCVQSGLHIELAIRSYPNFVITVVEAIAGTLVICYLSRGLMSTTLTSWLVIFGRNSIILLCIHHLDLYWVFWGGLIHSSWCAMLLRLVVDIIIMALVLIVKYLLSKIKEHG